MDRVELGNVLWLVARLFAALFGHGRIEVYNWRPFQEAVLCEFTDDEPVFRLSLSQIILYIASGWLIPFTSVKKGGF